MSLTEPLAAKLRPRNLNNFIGQEHLLAPGLPLYEALNNNLLHSMILWGPPGSGKTTLAKLLASSADAEIEEISAVLCGVKDIRAAIERAKLRQQQGTATVLFVDEVHRFNKSQQDAFLPYVESGLVTLIGATTENPAFELNNALLSRASVYILKALTKANLLALVNAALKNYDMTIEQPQLLVESSNGDARKCLNYLELAIAQARSKQINNIDEALLTKILTSEYFCFDKGGDSFYDQISALHKSIRGSSPDAALFWGLAMLKGGATPQYILRRLLRIASEDVGNADPRSLEIVLNAWDSFDRLGMPEGELVIGQAILYLASAPKSNAVYMAYKKCKLDILSLNKIDVPIHLRNAPTKLSKLLNHGAAYKYPHDYPNAYVPNENYFPINFKKNYYFPVERGLELKIKHKFDVFSKINNQLLGTN